MKKLEKLLAKPVVQRLVYLLLLLLCIGLYSTNGSISRFYPESFADMLPLLVACLPLLLLPVQFFYNRRWLWRVICGLFIGFTIWLATLSMPQLIAGTGSAARSLVWAAGVIGFTVVLVMVIAFLTWVLLHMKPKR